MSPEKQVTKATRRTSVLNSPPVPTEGRKRIAFTCNRGQGLHLFRREVITELLETGYEVYIISPFDAYIESFIALGAKFHNIDLLEQSTSIFGEFKSLVQLNRIYRDIKPDLAFHYTIKANIYGALVAAKHHVACINVVPGLGAFPDVSLYPLRLTVQKGYQYAVKKAKETWFLNAHDQGYFEANGWLKATTCRILPGEGVNTGTFSFSPSSNRYTPKILFLGRLIASKGIRVFAKAAKLCKAQGVNVSFSVVGFIDESHPDGISSQELQSWVEEGFLSYKGTTSNPAEVIRAIDIIVIPTVFREGLNRVIQESLSMGRTVITTPVPGAGELVQHNETGYVVPPNDPQAIVDSIQYHFSLSETERTYMARLGAKRIREKYDVNHVLPHYWDAIARHCHPKK